MTSEKADKRRRYSTMTKAQVVAQCAEPGAPVAKTAMAHGINANVVHRWRKLARGGDAEAAKKTGEFIALHLTMARAPVAPTAADPAVPDLQVELRRGAITMSITWPTNAAAEFALWTRELLRRFVWMLCGLPVSRWTCEPAPSRRSAGWSRVFGEARPHHAYLFANRRANRMKVLVHDGIGVWLAARRLNAGRFIWPNDGSILALTRPQLEALVRGLPWQRIGEAGVIRIL